jgi:hypothetical protein
MNEAISPDDDLKSFEVYPDKAPTCSRVGSTIRRKQKIHTTLLIKNDSHEKRLFVYRYYNVCVCVCGYIVDAVSEGVS